MKRINCNHKNKTIHLYPDFAATGMWCECGVGFGDPESHFPHVPSGLIALISIWNWNWDFIASSENYNYYKENNTLSYHQEEIYKSGRELEKILMKYHPCKFIEESARIPPPLHIPKGF